MRGLYPAPPDEEPPVSVSAAAASLPRADAPLKRCAHCGGAPRWEWQEASGNVGWRVACQECYAGDFLQDRAEALTAWENRRDGEDARIDAAVRAERARIMDELAELEDVIMDWGNYYLATYQLWDVVNPGVERPADGGKVPKPFRDDNEP